MDQKTYDKIFNACRKVCRQAGYPVDREVEYRSAINWAIYRAMRTNRWETTLLPIAPAILYSLERCKNIEWMLRRWRKQDECGALRLKAPRTHLAVPFEDFELLKFVACYGRHKSAILLRIGHNRLRSRLDEIALKVSEESA